MRAIVKPGTPWWVLGIAPDPNVRLFRGQTLAVAGVALLTMAMVFVLIALGHPLSVTLGVAGIAAAIGFFVLATREYRRSIILPDAPAYRGVPLTGEGLELLQDIDARFGYAQGVMDDLPASLGSVDMDDEVAALLWDAAGHAARVSALDRELVEMRYAAAGSPAAVYREELERARADHMRAMKRIQLEAEGVARMAGQASAAAKLARERTGSAYELEIVIPDASNASTASALEAAKERLGLAASAWAELDETTKIKQAQLNEERRQQLEG